MAELGAFTGWMEAVGMAVDGAGVAAVVIGGLAASIRFALKRGPERPGAFRSYRQDLGRAILLGLEFLVAGDIIRTVVVAPTLTNVFILAIIVLVRTFLSFTLELELEGRWPWQEGHELGTTAAPVKEQ